MYQEYFVLDVMQVYRLMVKSTQAVSLGALSSCGICSGRNQRAWLGSRGSCVSLQKSAF